MAAVDGVDISEFWPVLDALLKRLKASIVEHGDWREYGPERVFEAVSEEFDEYREAFVSGRRVGDHGQVDELLDVAVTSIKGALRLGGG